MTKGELSRYYYLKKEIKQIEERIKEIDDTFLSANRINGMRYEKRLSNPQEQRMILIEKYDKRLEEKKDEALKELMKIENFIDSINDPEIRMIFRYRYIELMEWNKIVMLVHMSERTVYRNRSRSLPRECSEKCRLRRTILCE